MTMASASQVEVQSAEAPFAPPTEREQYRFLNFPFTHAEGVFMLRQGVSGALAQGESVSKDQIMDKVKVERFAKVNVDWGLVQGHLVEGKKRGSIMATEEGRKIFAQAPEMAEVLQHNGALMDAVKLEHGMRHALNVWNLPRLLNGQQDTLIGRQSLITPAITYLAGLRLNDESEYSTAGELLLRARALTLDDFEARVEVNRNLFLDLLHTVGVTQPDSLGSEIDLTKRGRSLIIRAGSAELTLSYYQMLAQQHELALGEEVYGFDKDSTLRRDAELNAHASNGITKVSAAPLIVKQLTEHPVLKEALGEKGAYIDYGSGGGHMLIHAAQEGPDSVKKHFGMDINRDTIDESQQLVEREGLEGTIELMTGSITEEADMLALRERIVGAGIDLKRAVFSVNTIIHDIGPEAAAKFLRLHAEIFPDSLLIITEALRMPMDVLKHNPDSRAPSFQYMHDASGQHLFYEDEQRKLLADCGFEIVSEDVISTLNGPDGTVYKQSVNWVTRPRR